MPTLKVKVIGCRDLQRTDSLSGCDPYLKLTCDGTTHKTKTIKATVDPNYNEHFTFDSNGFVDKKNQPVLRVEVFDWDRIGKDDLAGTCTVQLHTLVKGEPMEEWMPLTPCGSVGLVLEAVEFGRPADAFLPVAPPLSEDGSAVVGPCAVRRRVDAVVAPTDAFGVVFRRVLLGDAYAAEDDFTALVDAIACSFLSFVYGEDVADDSELRQRVATLYKVLTADPNQETVMWLLQCSTKRLDESADGPNIVTLRAFHRHIVSVLQTTHDNYVCQNWDKVDDMRKANEAFVSAAATKKTATAATPSKWPSPWLSALEADRAADEQLDSKGHYVLVYFWSRASAFSVALRDALVKEYRLGKDVPVGRQRAKVVIRCRDAALYVGASRSMLVDTVPHLMLCHPDRAQARRYGFPAAIWDPIDVDARKDASSICVPGLKHIATWIAEAFASSSAPSTSAKKQDTISARVAAFDWDDIKKKNKSASQLENERSLDTIPTLKPSPRQRPTDRRWVCFLGLGLGSDEAMLWSYMRAATRLQELNTVTVREADAGGMAGCLDSFAASTSEGRSVIHVGTLSDTAAIRECVHVARQYPNDKFRYDAATNKFVSILPKTEKAAKDSCDDDDDDHVHPGKLVWWSVFCLCRPSAPPPQSRDFNDTADANGAIEGDEFGVGFFASVTGNIAATVAEEVCAAVFAAKKNVDVCALLTRHAAFATGFRVFLSYGDAFAIFVGDEVVARRLPPEDEGEDALSKTGGAFANKKTQILHDAKFRAFLDLCNLDPTAKDVAALGCHGI